MATRDAGSAPRVVRHFSDIECYMEARYHAGQYQCNTISCRLSTSSNVSHHAKTGNLQRAFEQVVTELVREHPILQVAVSGHSDRQPRWTSLKQVDLLQHIHWSLEITTHSSTEYDEIVHEQREKLVDTYFEDRGERPGWRLDVFSSATDAVVDIMFTYTHSIADGKGGLVFLRSLLRKLRQTPLSECQDSTTQHQVACGENLLLPPSPHQLCTFSFSPWFILSTVWKELRPDSLRFTPNTPADWCPPTSHRVPTRLLSFQIDQGTLDCVLESFREHSATLTGLLHGIILVSLSKYLTDDQARVMTGVTTIDLRRFMPKSPPDFPWFDPADTMGNFSSGMEHAFDEATIREVRRLKEEEGSQDNRLDDHTWDVAQRTCVNIRERLLKELSDDITGMMKFVKDWRVETAKKRGLPREHTWIISNLGGIQATEARNQSDHDGHGWNLRSAVFSLSSEAVGAPLRFSLLTVQGQGLSVELSWQKDQLQNGLAEKLLTEVNRQLLRRGYLA